MKKKADKSTNWVGGKGFRKERQTLVLQAHNRREGGNPREKGMVLNHKKISFLRLDQQSRRDWDGPIKDYQSRDITTLEMTG